MDRPVGSVEVEAVEGCLGEEKLGEDVCGDAGYHQVDRLPSSWTHFHSACVPFPAGVLVEGGGDPSGDVPGQARRGEGVGEGHRAEPLANGVEELARSGGQPVERLVVQRGVVEGGALGQPPPRLSAFDEVAEAEMATASFVEVRHVGDE